MSKLSQYQGSWGMVIGLALLSGALAGVCGGIIGRVYIWPDLAPSFSSEVNLSNLNANNAGLVIQDPKTVVVNQDLKVAETASNIRPVLVGIFKELATSSPASAKERAEYYKLDEPLFVGLIITADGWVMALPPADSKTDFKAKDYVAIGADRRIYQIDQPINLKSQPGAPLIFRLVGASNLPVKKIAPRADLTMGQSLLIVQDANSVRPATLASITKTPAVLSSDQTGARLSLNGAADDSRNAFVFDLAGNLVAVITADQSVVPAFSYAAAWSALSAGGPAKPLYLGVNYLDLSTVKTTALNLDKGAWLYPSTSSPAVLKGSPAALAGLQAGDVITWVNNQEINAANDLADLLAAYRPGNVVTLTYQRAGVEKSVEIKLGERK